jgi:diamine N-acetyltransferase
MLKLIPIDENNYRECLRLKVTEEQLQYVSNSNALSLAKAYVYYGKAFPYAIYKDDIMIGFILLRDRDDLENYSIEKIMIDKEYQGNGYGKSIIKNVIDGMKKESKYRKVCICCNVNNYKAIKIYESFGFKIIEEEEEKEIVLGIEW